ncbi:Elongation factor 1-gamma 1 [Trichoderma cornu-damae]|uniref:Elongation factor 1-gamma 1 n=1 Tax=Trichoderma cornu-damae TaxID=654480 RepID=A0A9P8QV50_9HYPO|nr:Elongation factor 1-gamma 1 [Trichoderma cornu-damae]
MELLLFGARRVDSDAVVKVFLGCAHLDGNAKALQHLAASLAHDVQPNDPLFGAGDDQLVVGGALGLRVHHGVVQGGKGRLVDLDVVPAVLFHGLRLREADGADLGMRKHDGWDVFVAELQGRELGGAEEPVREAAPGSNGDGRQLDLAGDVAERVDVVGAGVLVVVHDDVSLVVELDAGFLQADAARQGRPADGPDEVVDVAKGALAAIGIPAGDGQLAVGVPVDPGGLGLPVEAHSQALVLVGDGLLDHGVKVPQEGLASDQQVGFRAEGVEHAGKLDGDVAGADNGHLAGLPLNVEEAVAVDAQLGPGDLGRVAGLAPDGDEDLLGVDQHLGPVVQSHLGLVLGQQPAPSVQVVDLVVGEIPLVDAVEPLDVGVALGLEGGPVKGRRVRHGEAVVLGVVDGLGEGRGVVPPRRELSTTMALTPYLELAMRAEPRPPLPPPMTR